MFFIKLLFGHNDSNTRNTSNNTNQTANTNTPHIVRQYKINGITVNEYAEGMA